MLVSKWGNSLAVRIPAVVVEALKLQEGDDIEIRVVGARSFEIDRRESVHALLSSLRKYRGRLPEGFNFDRLDANERG